MTGDRDKKDQIATLEALIADYEWERDFCRRMLADYKADMDEWERRLAVVRAVLVRLEAGQ